jgi:hypothetical protein
LKDRARAIGYWAAPSLVMLALYWRGLTAWFQKDDFVWLSLRDLHRTHSLAWILFQPMAQGTIRTLSERVVYLSFVTLFGLHAPPFHIFAFATCAGAAATLSAVTSKLTGSSTAGFWAAMVWVMGCALAVPLVWAAVYNELAWPFCLLLMFWLLLRYADTGDWRFYAVQCAIFVLGFFVLELNVVYPAIAAVFAVTWPAARQRKLLLKILPLFAISAIYTWVHLGLAPLHASGPYKMYWDARAFQTFTIYWGYALGPGQGRVIDVRSTFARSIGVWTITIALLAFLVVKLRQRNWIAGLLPAWFVIALSPVLPLRDHIQPEYLTAPALGIAIWAGWAIVTAWRANVAARFAAVAALAIYAGFSIPINQAVVRSFVDRSQRIRTFVLSVTATAGEHPGKLVLLEGVNAEQFNDALYHRAFGLFGIADIRVVTEDPEAMGIAPYFTETNQFFETEPLARESVRQNRAVVFDVSSGTAHDVTAGYAGR